MFNKWKDSTGRIRSRWSRGNVSLLTRIWEAMGGNRPAPYVKPIAAPLEETFKITRNCSHGLSLGMMRSANPEGTIDLNTYNVLGELRSKVYIFNISPMGHDVSGTFIKNGKIPASIDGNPTLYTSIPEIIRTPKYNATLDSTDFMLEDGKRIAMDLINPDNLGLDQDVKTSAWSSSIGRNLSDRGVFWSLSNPPTGEEVAAAHKRMTKHFTYILERIDTLEFLFKNADKTDKAALRVARTQYEEAITPEAHAAVSYLGQAREWHRDNNPVTYKTQETQ